jgi:hypothetical protein
MTDRRLRRAHSSALLAACAIAAVLLIAPGPAGAAGQIPVGLSMDRDQVSNRLGESFYLRSTITNEGPTPLSGLIAHLNVVSFTHGVYVDPEDWSGERTVYLPELGPGASEVVPWRVKSVNAGDFAVYVTVLPSEAPAAGALDPAVGPATDVHVAEQRTLNSGGVLPLTLAIPALLGLLALTLRRRRA